jgi:hypothetical protein
LIVGGRAARAYEGVLQTIGSPPITDPQELRERLEQLRYHA